MLKAVTAYWQNWVDRRVPRDDTRVFGQKNIFIVPSAAGVVFGLLLLVMLLTGINYQNSLIYLLTFLLGTVFVAAMHQTHRNLSGLQITLVKAGEGFAGDAIPFVFRASAPNHDALAITLSHDQTRVDQQHVMAGKPLDMQVLVPSRARGYLVPTRIRVETRFPFGLLVAWSWLRPASAGLVYPRPIAAPEVGSSVVDDGEVDETRETEGQDHADLRPWRQGDMSQRVLWKRFARTGDMVIADWEGEQGSPHWLDYDAFSGVDRELRLSYLTALVIARANGNAAFGLRLPGQTIEPDNGQLHVQRCLRALATCGLERPREATVAAYGSRTGEPAAAVAQPGESV